MQPKSKSKRFDMADVERELSIALIGNPNTGKTSLFNALTGMRQRVSNYPGVTVEKKTGRWTLPSGRKVQLVDLPGTYSLSASSLDERIAVDVLAGRITGQPAPDLIIVVVDVENLQRNLFLASQASELDVPMVIALNCWDVAERKGLQIDCKLLEQRLGVPVAPTVATRNRGTEELARIVEEAIVKKPMMVRPIWPESIKTGMRTLREELVERRGESLSNGELQRLIFDPKSAVSERLKTSGAEDQKIIRDVRNHIYKEGLNPNAAESILRFRFLNPLLNDIIARQAALKKRTKSESIDQILLHRFWGLVVFVGMMYIVFQSVYIWAAPFMDLIEGGVGILQTLVGGALAGTPMLQSLMVDGIIGGVGAFLVFLPQILVLFLFISLLEESGYMARAAFLSDKFLSWCGLSGKSSVPLLSSYACAVPGILATRTISDPKARLITILIAPLMSCSARLPVYILFIGAFIEPRYGPAVAGTTLFAMHFVGVVFAAPIAWVLSRTLNKGQRQKPYLMELPSYRAPRVETMFNRMFESGKEFIIRAGTVIFAITIIIWALLYFPRPTDIATEVSRDFIKEQGVTEIDEATQAKLDKRIDAAYLEQSYLGRLGKFIQPVFAPAGYDWKITVGVLASFPAREVIISTLGITYALGGEVDEESNDLRDSLSQAKWESGARAGRPVFTIPVALSIMVFFALCMQCGATVAVIAKELNWGWAIGSFFALTIIAWLAAVITYQIGMLFV